MKTPSEKAMREKMIIDSHKYSSLLVAFAVTAVVGCARPPHRPDTDVAKQRVQTLYEKYRQRFPQVREASVPDLLAMRRDGKVVLVDVRPVAERQVSVIPGAIALEDFEQNADFHDNEPVVFYCTLGYRSARVALQYQRQGLKTYNLREGILGWVHQGHPVQVDEKEMKRVHVYGPQWNLVPRGYEAVW